MRPLWHPPGLADAPTEELALPRDERLERIYDPYEAWPDERPHLSRQEQRSQVGGFWVGADLVLLGLAVADITAAIDRRATIPAGTVLGYVIVVAVTNVLFAVVWATNRPGRRRP